MLGQRKSVGFIEVVTMLFFYVTLQRCDNVKGPGDNLTGPLFLRCHNIATTLCCRCNNVSILRCNNVNV